MALRVVPKYAPDDDIEVLTDAKLASSGIGKEFRDRLGIKAYTADQFKALDQQFAHLPAMYIPYYDPLTGKPTRPGPNHPEFGRYRVLREPVPVPDGFAKYTQSGGTGVAPYFPPIMDWHAIIPDWRVPVIITEGELKAIKGCVENFPVIGLGGVWSWKSLKQGWVFLPELEAVVWPRRETFIIFDSDARENPQVCKALQALADALLERGALPRTVILPAKADGWKMGLDDFLIEYGRDALNQLLARADHLTLARPLWGLNEQYAYIRDPGLVVEQATGRAQKPEIFRGHALTDKYYAPRVRDDGEIEREFVSASEAWLKWPLRREAERMAYCPGAAPLSVVEENGKPVYNTWSGWGAEAKKGDVRLFVKLIDHLFTGAEPEAKQYFWQWMAWPVVHPGAKLLTAAVVHSIHQGNGKSLIGVTLSRVYGANYAAVTQDNMDGAFNNWANGRQFIMIDDVTSTDKRRDLDRMKATITQETIWINIKHIPEYCVRDTINYYISSNHQDVLALEQMDRRFFVHEATVQPLPAQFYRDYDTWLHGPDCGAALHYHLKHAVDLVGFNPNAAPPMTQAKKGMTRLAQTDIDAWLIDALADPDEFLRVGGVPVKSDLLSLAEIRSCYMTYAGRDPDISQIGLARKLAARGVRLINNGDNVFVTGRPYARYYVVRNHEKWAKAGIEVVRRYLGGAAADARMEKKFAKKVIDGDAV